MSEEVRKMSKVKKAMLIASIPLVAAAFSFSAITVAKYVEGRSVGQEVSRNQMENISIFLNANIWNEGKDSGGNIVDAVYYMWLITGVSSGQLITPTRHVTPTVSSTVMDLYVFEYKYTWGHRGEDPAYGFLFIRGNPEEDIDSYTTWPTAAVWNQTHDIPYNSARNYYCIVGWENPDNGEDHDSPYTYNSILKTGSTLYWGNPTGHDEWIKS